MLKMKRMTRANEFPGAMSQKTVKMERRRRRRRRASRGKKKTKKARKVMRAMETTRAKTKRRWVRCRLSRSSLQTTLAAASFSTSWKS
jgi:hypothetical protein